MNSFGNTIRKLREESGGSLQTISAYLDVDEPTLIKIEQDQYEPTRMQVVKIADYFAVDSNELLIAWLSDKLLYELKEEEIGMKALQMAEDKVAYNSFKKIDRGVLLKELIKGIGKFSSIEKAWIYGSFSREDDGPKSDIDIAVKTDSSFSYFDLAEVQFQLEQKVNRKVDVGFIDSFKPYIFEHVKPELKLIYDRPA